MRRRSRPLLLLAIAASVVVVVSRVLPAPAEAMLPGALFALGGAERSLAILGLGLAGAAAGHRSAILTLLALAAGMALASALPHTAVWPLLTEAPTYRHLHLLPGPSACCLTGLALALPARWRAMSAAFLAGPTGLALGLAAVLNDPDPDIGVFVAGAGICVLVVAAAVTLVVRAIRRPWFDTAERIAGSWLLAIGLMLGGAGFVAAPPPGIALPAVPSPRNPLDPENLGMGTGLQLQPGPQAAPRTLRDGGETSGAF